ncbi:MAG: hypothetical protein FJW39_09900, partial [Acidobacteria bacterium]|nr:hypothetical protein [Acidobacteriota bacterium]
MRRGLNLILWPAVLACTPAHAQLFQPAAGSPFSVGAAPHAPNTLALGDFNNDGKVDIITGNNTGASISLLTGNGAGGFVLGPGSPFASPGPGRMVTHDSTRNGNLDVAVVDSGAGFYFRRGNGDGTFSGVFGVGGVSTSFRIAKADFNKDGLIDFVASDSTSAVRIILGTADGSVSFQPIVNFEGPTWLTTGDFNNDGNPDFVAGSVNGVVMRLGNGAGATAGAGFTLAGGNIVEVTSGDFNNDGKRDVAALISGNKVAILLGNGTGGFTAAAGSPFDTGAGPLDIATADLDNDGNLDLAIANQTGSSVTVLKGNGSGGFAPFTGSPFAAPGGPVQIAIGDVDSDLRPDLILATPGTRTVTVLRNTMVRRFFLQRQLEFFTTFGATSATVIPSTLSAEAPGSGGGLTSDVSWLTATFGCTGVCINANPAGLSPGIRKGIARANFLDRFSAALKANLHVTKPAGGVTSSVKINTGATARGTATGDFNADGKPDLAVTNQGANNVSVLLGNGTGGFSAAPGSPLAMGGGTGPEALVAADFNNDGRLDLAVANTSASNVSILLGLGTGAFFASGTIAVGTLPAAITSADFNNDGNTDLATSNNTGSVNILLGNGFGGFSSMEIGGIAQGKSIAAGDFNHDGRADLANAGDPGVEILLGNGMGGFTDGTTVAATGGFWVSVSDFNADGHQDLAVARNSGNAVAVFNGAGDGTFAQMAGSPFAVTGGPQWIAVDDLNGDGRPDLAVSTASGAAKLKILTGTAGGFLAAPGDFGAFGGASLVTGDFNVDGFRDIAVANLVDGINVLFGGEVQTTMTVVGPASAIPMGVAFGLTADVRTPHIATVPIYQLPSGTVQFTNGLATLGGATLNFAGQVNSAVSLTAQREDIVVRQPGQYSTMRGISELSPGFLGSVAIVPDVTITPGTVSVQGGSNQSTTVGTQFGTALQAKVVNSQGNPVAGVTVNFAAPNSGASASLPTSGAVTNAQGIASINATANTVAGAYNVNATVTGIAAGVSFGLTNNAGAAASVTANAGTPQSATVNTQFGAGLQAKVSDANGNPVQGATVNFAAPGVGASATLSAPSAVTNAQGLASVNATAKGIAGSYNVTANVTGVATGATFALTNLSGAPGTIIATAGTPQPAAVGTQFAIALQVQVKDSNLNPVNNVQVTFTPPNSGASATLSSPTANTNAQGFASVTATANSVAGTYNVTASASGVATPATFALTNTAGAAGSIAAISGTPQSAAVGAAFAFALQAKVLDAGGNPVSGVTVTFTPPASGASATLSSATAVTNASGNAQVNATANLVAGTYNVIAAAPGVATPAAFALTNTAGGGLRDRTHP